MANVKILDAFIRLFADTDALTAALDTVEKQAQTHGKATGQALATGIGQGANAAAPKISASVGDSLVKAEKSALTAGQKSGSQYAKAFGDAAEAGLKVLKDKTAGIAEGGEGAARGASLAERAFKALGIEGKKAQQVMQGLGAGLRTLAPSLGPVASQTGAMVTNLASLGKFAGPVGVGLAAIGAVAGSYVLAIAAAAKATVDLRVAQRNLDQGAVQQQLTQTVRAIQNYEERLRLLEGPNTGLAAIMTKLVTVFGLFKDEVTGAGLEQLKKQAEDARKAADELFQSVGRFTLQADALKDSANAMEQFGQHAAETATSVMEHSKATDILTEAIKQQERAETLLIEKEQILLRNRLKAKDIGEVEFNERIADSERRLADVRTKAGLAEEQMRRRQEETTRAWARLTREATEGVAREEALAQQTRLRASVEFAAEQAKAFTGSAIEQLRIERQLLDDVAQIEAEKLRIRREGIAREAALLAQRPQTREVQEQALAFAKQLRDIDEQAAAAQTARATQRLHNEQQTIQQIRALEESLFQARKQMGEVTIAEEQERLRVIAADRQRSEQDRLQAALTASQQLREVETARFELRRALEQASLRDEVTRQQAITQATKVGTLERIKAETELAETRKRFREAERTIGEQLIQKALSQLQAEGQAITDMAQVAAKALDLARESQQRLSGAFQQGSVTIDQFREDLDFAKVLKQLGETGTTAGSAIKAAFAGIESSAKKADAGGLDPLDKAILKADQDIKRFGENAAEIERRLSQNPFRAMITGLKDAGVAAQDLGIKAGTELPDKIIQGLNGMDWTIIGRKASQAFNSTLALTDQFAQQLKPRIEQAGGAIDFSKIPSEAQRAFTQTLTSVDTFMTDFGNRIKSGADRIAVDLADTFIKRLTERLRAEARAQ